MKQPSQARKGTNTRALLEVIRDNSLGPIWQDKGLTLSWIAEVVLTQAGFTDAEIASLFGGKTTPKVAPKATKPAKKIVRRVNNGQSWTKAEDDSIVKMWSQGHTATKIAKELKRTDGSINLRVHLLRKQRGDKVVQLRRPDTRLRFSKK